MSASVVSQCLAMVSPAESAFRSRWRLSTLQRINPDLHDMLLEQMALYETALVTGSDAEAKLQSEAMVRGWRAACAALEAPLQSDDAYLVGWDAGTATKVVISDQRSSVGRVQIKDGERVLMVTPDEVARVIGGMRMIAEAKAIFPDAEIVQLSPVRAA